MTRGAAIGGAAATAAIGGLLLWLLWLLGSAADPAGAWSQARSRASAAAGDREEVERTATLAPPVEVARDAVAPETEPTARVRVRLVETEELDGIGFATIRRMAMPGTQARAIDARERRRFEVRQGEALLVGLPVPALLQLDVITARGGGQQSLFLEPGGAEPTALVAANSMLALYRWRLLDDDDRPIRDTVFELCRDVAMLTGVEPITSGPDGAVEVVIAAPANPDELMAELPVMRLAWRDGARQQFARLAPERPFAPGIHDEGNARFDGGSLVLGGRCVNERGDPLAGVALRFGAAGGGRRGREWLAERTSGADGRFELRDVDSPTWIAVALADPTGVATLDGVPWLPVPGTLSRWSAAASGDDEVELVLRRAAPVRGRLVGIASAPPIALHGALRFRGEPAPFATAPLRIALSAGGEFDWPIAERGALELDLLLHQADGPRLMTVAFELAGGAEEADLGALSVAERVALAWLRVVDESGVPIEGASVRSGANGSWVARSTADGCVVALAPTEGAAVLVAAGGYAPRIVRAEAAETFGSEGAPRPVTLAAAGVTMRAIAPSVGGLDWRRLRIHVELEQVNAEADAIRGLPPEERELLLRSGESRAIVTADADGSVRLPCGVPGRWSLRIYCIDGGSYDLGTYAIEVPTVAAPCTAEVPLDRACLDRAVADAARARSRTR